jgi:hypothetical protein
MVHNEAILAKIKRYVKIIATTAKFLGMLVLYYDKISYIIAW